jgi:hypothetical protein
VVPCQVSNEWTLNQRVLFVRNLSLLALVLLPTRPLPPEFFLLGSLVIFSCPLLFPCACLFVSFFAILYICAVVANIRTLVLVIYEQSILNASLGPAGEALIQIFELSFPRQHRTPHTRRLTPSSCLSLAVAFFVIALLLLLLIHTLYPKGIFASHLLPSLLFFDLPSSCHLYLPAPTYPLLSFSHSPSFSPYILLCNPPFLQRRDLLDRIFLFPSHPT